MLKTTLPMRRSGGEVVSLGEVLKAVHDSVENRVVHSGEWRLAYFYGVGEAPGGMSMDEFEDLVRSTEGGIIVDWGYLIDFSRQVDQVYDISIFLLDEGDGSCIFSIEAHDSSFWEISSRVELSKIENLA